MTRAATASGLFVRHVRLEPGSDTGRYPFTLPVVTGLAASGGLELSLPVTFLVGENGTGKSTLVEALATAAGFNPEGGSQAFRFATRASESSLGDALILRWGRKPRTGLFLRAASYYNVVSEIERLDQDPGSPPLLPAYRGTSPRENPVPLLLRTRDCRRASRTDAPPSHAPPTTRSPNPLLAHLLPQPPAPNERDIPRSLQ